MNYGYIRVSTRDQNEERQRLAAGSADNAPETAPASEPEQGAGTAPAQVPADSEKGGEAQ